MFFHVLCAAMRLEVRGDDSRWRKGREHVFGQLALKHAEGQAASLSNKL
jgi:hypothetical protein